MSRTLLLFIFLLSLAAIAIGVAWNNGQFPKEWTDTIQKYVAPYGINVETSTNTNSTNAPDVSSTASSPNNPNSIVSPPPQYTGTLPLPPPNAKDNYAGQGPFSSRPFVIGDQWEVDWDSPGPITVTLCHLDGRPDEVIGQQPGPSHGSSFQPQGGQYYLKITGSGPWVAWTIPLKNAGGVAVAPSLPANSAPVNSGFGLPLPPSQQPVSAALTDNNTDYIQKSIVIVQGANGSGTGFLAKIGQSTCVVTNQHVISNNPNLSFQTMTGQTLQVIGIQAATDRDLALITVRNDGDVLSTMPLANSVSDTARPQDPVMVPGNSQGGAVVVNTPGTIVGIGPVRVEVTNPVFPGNSGSPVVDLKLKQAIGVITEAEKSDDDGWLNQGSLANQNSAIKSIRYFSLRLDNVPAWEKIDLQRYYAQTHFIETFHEKTLELASFIHVLVSPNNPGSGDEMTLYRNNPKLSELMDQFNASMTGSSDGDIQAKAQEYLFDLKGVAEADVSSMNNPALFYSFNRSLTHDEVELRNEISNACDKAFNRVTNRRIGLGQ